MAGVSSLKLLSVTLADPSVVNVTVHSSSQNPVPVEVAVYESGTNKIVASQNSKSDIPFQFSVPSAKLWSPDSPTLYNVTVTMGSDKVGSYTGFRTISKGTVDGVVRPLLNGEFIFMFGTLDQGFWPDGIYTPPSRDAMVYDLQMLKNLGFNMLRKHVRCWLLTSNNHRANISKDQSRERFILPSLRSNGTSPDSRYARLATFAKL